MEKSAAKHPKKALVNYSGYLDVSFSSLQMTKEIMLQYISGYIISLLQNVFVPLL